MGLGLWILPGAGSWQGLRSSSLLNPDPTSPWPLVVLPCWQPVPPTLGDAHVCAGLSQCLPPLPSDVCLPKTSPPSSPTHNSCQAPLSLGFRHRGRVQFLPACLPRKDLITCPPTLWGSGGPIATSLWLAHCPSATHKELAASCEHRGDVSDSRAKPLP